MEILLTSEATDAEITPLSAAPPIADSARPGSWHGPAGPAAAGIAPGSIPAIDTPAGVVRP